jgi:hypothetical protein
LPTLPPESILVEGAASTSVRASFLPRLPFLGVVVSDRAAPAEPFATGILDMGHPTWARWLAAALLVGGTGCLASVTLAAWGDEAPGTGLGEAAGLFAASSLLAYALLRTATSRVVVDRVGVHVLDGSDELATWDELAARGGERCVRTTRSENYPRLIVGPLEIDDFVASSGARKRIAQAVRAGLADPASRPADVTTAQPFPLYWTLLVFVVLDALVCTGMYLQGRIT